jgi:hypothetical protein
VGDVLVIFRLVWWLLARWLGVATISVEMLDANDVVIATGGKL